MIRLLRKTIVTRESYSGRGIHLLLGELQRNCGPRGNRASLYLAASGVANLDLGCDHLKSESNPKTIPKNSFGSPRATGLEPLSHSPSIPHSASPTDHNFLA